MLAPSVMSVITVEQRTFRRAPTDSTSPSSSIIPVNIHVSFDGEFVRRNLVNGHAPDADGVCTPAPPQAAGQRERFQPAQNLGPVIEKDAVDHPALERRPI